MSHSLKTNGNGWASLAPYDYSPLLSAGTIEFWFRLNNTVSGSLFGSNPQVKLKFIGGKCVADWGLSSAGVLSTTTTFVVNNWYYLAFTWNEGTNTLKFYVGDQTTGALLDNSTALWTDSITGLSCSASVMAAYNSINKVIGDVAEFRIWSTERSAGDIATYAAPGALTSLLPIPNLLGLYLFDGDYIDETGNNNGTAGGTGNNFVFDDPYATSTTTSISTSTSTTTTSVSTSTSISTSTSTSTSSTTSISTSTSTSTSISTSTSTTQIPLLQYFKAFPDTGTGLVISKFDVQCYVTSKELVDLILESPIADEPPRKKIDQVRFKVNTGAWSVWENYSSLPIVSGSDPWHTYFNPPPLGGNNERRRKIDLDLGAGEGLKTVYVEGINADGDATIIIYLCTVTTTEAEAVITPYYKPDQQLTSISSGRNGTLATQWIGGFKSSTHKVIINGFDPGYDLYEGYGDSNWISGNNRMDAYGTEWKYEMPLWFGPNPILVEIIPKPFIDGYEETYFYEQDIFLERVYIPQQPGIVKADGYDSTSYSIEGTYYTPEGYGAPSDAYGSTDVLFSCAQTQFPPKLRVKFLTNRELSSGVITNGTERQGYEGYKKYFGLSPLMDDHYKHLVTFTDGYGHYYSDRTDGLNDGYGVFRDPLRNYGDLELVVVDGEQLQILPNAKYDVYDEAENQTFIISQGRSERILMYEGQTLVQLSDIPEVIDQIQIYREHDYITRTAAALPESFDSIRKVLTITPFDADGYGFVYARIGYTTAGSKTSINQDLLSHPFPNNFRETPDGYGVNEDILEDNSLEFDFTTSLKRKSIGLERNYESEFLDEQTDQKMRMIFFKKNEFDIELQLNPDFTILHGERFARLGNKLNPYYYDNGKREIILHVDFRGLDLGIEGYGI